jgi:hypothetical protein
VPADSYQRQLVRLAFLAPDIQEAIVAGTLPPGLTLESLLSGPLPVSWAKQRQLLLANPSARAENIRVQQAAFNDIAGAV